MYYVHHKHVGAGFEIFREYDVNTVAADVLIMQDEHIYVSGLILGLHPANERRRYKVTPSLIGWAHT